MTVGGLPAILLHRIPYPIDQGMDPTHASWVLGGTAGVGVVGKLGFGAFLDRYEQRTVVVVCFGLQALGADLLFFAANPVILALHVLVYGYSMGGNATGVRSPET